MVWLVNCLFHSYYSVITLSSEDKRSSCCCIGSQVYKSSRPCGKQIKIKGQFCWSSNITAQHSKAAKQDDVPRETLIWRAIKLPIYSVALVPITVRYWFCLSCEIHSVIAVVLQNGKKEIFTLDYIYWILSPVM